MRNDAVDSSRFEESGGASAGAGGSASYHGNGSTDDGVSVEQMLAGDERALRNLIDRYDKLVRYTIFRSQRDHCRRDPAWLDARANEAWTGIVNSLRKSGGRGLPDSLSAYFIQIARNKCIDAVRRAGEAAVIPFDEALAAPDAASQVTPEEENPLSVAENLEQIENLRSCMGRLSEEDRVLCAEISLIMERKWSEAAERLGMAESTLRSRWVGVTNRLKSCLEKKIEKIEKKDRA